MRYEERIGMDVRKECLLLALLLVALPSCGPKKKAASPKKSKKDQKKSQKVAQADRLTPEALCDDLARFFDDDGDGGDAIAWVDEDTLDTDVAEESLKTVYNDFNHYGVSKDQKSTVAQNAETVKKVMAAADACGDPLTVVVEGHADTIGNPRYNKALSERRALSVAKKLEEAGVAPERLTVVGRGCETPATMDGQEVTGSAEEQWANRRVELHLVRA